MTHHETPGPQPEQSKKSSHATLLGGASAALTATGLAVVSFADKFPHQWELPVGIGGVAMCAGGVAVAAAAVFGPRP